MSSNCDWEAIFADPELTPESLLPLLVETIRSKGMRAKDGVQHGYKLSEAGLGAQRHFPVLWKNPSFSLMPLALPALGVLHGFVEEAWLEQQAKITDEEFCVLVRSQVRERAMPVLAETMRLAAKNMHPLVSILWAGRATWPCFEVGSTQYSSKPQHEWETILAYGRGAKVHLMEANAFRSIVALMYPLTGPSAYLHAIIALSLVGCPPLVSEVNLSRLTLAEKRLYRLADLHLLDHLRNGTKLNYVTLRAPRLVGAYPVSPLTADDRAALIGVAP